VRSRSSEPRSLLPLGIVLGLVALFATGIGLGQAFDIPFPSLPNFSRGDGPLDRANPTRLTIPSLDVRARVIEVGKANDGSIATPDDDPVRQAGWYNQGPSPGEAGTAVIVGHVDTQSEPAVFAKLAQLTAGATIEVRRSDWRTVTFTVDSLEMYPKTKFPADKVFEEADRPRLALVTCGGDWIGGDIGYADNLIVMATLAS
jgi:hypothetical protein